MAKPAGKVGMCASCQTFHPVRKGLLVAHAACAGGVPPAWMATTINPGSLGDELRVVQKAIAPGAKDRTFLSMPVQTSKRH